MLSRRLCLLVAFAALCDVPQAAAGDGLTNRSFHIQADAQGLTSLKRTGDEFDTDYIAGGGALGPLVVRYRTAVHGDWKTLRDVVRAGGSPSEVRYMLAAPGAAMAARASGSAVQGVGGIRALNDGLVPPSSAARGRRGGPGRAGPASDVPVFTWSPSRGPTQWVQYTFPVVQTIDRIEVFWTVPPRSWRLLYQAGEEWREVVRRGAYDRTVNDFAPLQFAPVDTMALRIEVTLDDGAPPTLAEWRVGPPPALAPPADLHVNETFALDGDAMTWTIALENPGPRPVEIGDLALPLEFAERTGGRSDIYTKKLLRHAFVAGHGSWVYWERSNAVGPYLLMVPEGQSKVEYYDSSAGAFTPYVHAAAAAAEARARGGTWRLPISSLRLAPHATRTYAFRFVWAKDVAAIRDALYRAGKFDTAVVPGMVLPTDLPAMISLRSTHHTISIAPEHPSSTRVEALPARPGVYRVSFSRLGENMLTIKYGNGQWTTLEFFVTEPLETVIRKRAAFLVHHQQHADPSKWYYGAYGDWDEKNEVLRGPEDRDGLSTWLTDADDDAGNARPAFVASKNVYLPDRSEIASLETYISRYLWGGMQMTDRERYPYAIYGVPNFKANRVSADEGRNGRAHVWRIYDYPHIVLLYYRMYQIAKFYPGMVKDLDAAGYLERAYRTAIAYWTVPFEIEKWSADAVGTMNEAIIPDVIDALEREGHAEWANDLRSRWEGKIDRFVNHTPNLYGSEFAFDSTGFESTGAFAKYGRTHAVPGVDPEAMRKFDAFQLALNMADRGWLESTYYQRGSDYRGNLSYLLSYMSQMGGWAILDHALYGAGDPTNYLRLGYASSLSSWALVNSGTASSGYGAWFPSRNNDGAAGGGFMPEASGRAWIGKIVARGAWYYSAEEDVGYCAALRTHATIVATDPAFGEVAYGGMLSRSGAEVRVIPRDGLRVRFHVIRDDQRLHMELAHDGFARERPIVVSDDLSHLSFTVENRSDTAHSTDLSLAGLPDGTYDVSVNGRHVARITGSKAVKVVALPVASSTSAVRIVRQ
jgi:hypothetical protein